MPPANDAADSHPPDFCTLGMLIIDDIYPPPSASNQEPQRNILGGAGTYSAIGARIFSPPPISKSVAWIVDAGTDFPSNFLTLLDSWTTNVLIRPRDAPTTRGWNGYSDNESRAFKYLTEKKRLTAEDLPLEFLRSRSFHLICSPTRCISLIQTLRARLEESFGEEVQKPTIIWEPVPDLCVPEELENTYQALQYVDVVSPNHEELGSLFGFKHDLHPDHRAIEDQVNRLLFRGVGQSSGGCVVVRVGKDGCYVADISQRKWLPAYFQESAKVVDPTGGGNGFLGGFAVGYVRSEGDMVEAARRGSVAASFCIEQVGLPTLETVSSSNDSTEESWNGESVQERLMQYKSRTTGDTDDDRAIRSS